MIVKEIALPSVDSRGAINVANGSSFEIQIATMLNVHNIENASAGSITLIKNICSCLFIDFSRIKNIIAYRQPGTRKADIFMCIIFDNFSVQEVPISVKGTIGETQFANIKTNSFIKNMGLMAQEGYGKFTGCEPYDKQWTNDFGHEDRNRYYKNELSRENKEAIIDESNKEEFRELLFDSLFGDSENKISLILAPKVNWDSNPNNMLFIDSNKVRNTLRNRYEKLPFTFIEDSIIHSQESKLVVCKVDKNGNCITPDGEGSIRFANGLISLKRKGSESSAKYGFNPTDIQIMSSAKSLYELHIL